MNHYQILEIDKTATIQEIKTSYRKLSLKYHPDKSEEKDKIENEKKFKEITEAYSVLSDPDKRNKYDNPSQPQPFIQNRQFININDIMRQMMNQFLNISNGSNGSNMNQFNINIMPNGQQMTRINIKDVNGKKIKETIIQQNGITQIITEEIS
jgi:DnaJ-class molecular chaperone